MLHERTFVGIDISKTRFDVHIHPSGGRSGAASSAAGIAGLVKRLAALAPAAIGLEASGGYERPLARALHAAGLKVYILPPARVRAFARAIGQAAKTDALDAAMIARCLEAGHDRLEPYAPDPERDRLSALGAHRRRLVAERSGLTSQLDTVAEPLVRRMIQARLRSIALGLALLDKAMRALIEASGLKRRFDRLPQVKGVGPVLAAALLADMPELGRIPAKAAAALIGVAPHARQSGASNRQGRCAGGRKALRDILYMAALSAVTARDQTLSNFYKRLRENGKPFKLALVATMRKLITILNAIAKTDPAFQPQ
jgi:transposase